MKNAIIFGLIIVVMILAAVVFINDRRILRLEEWHQDEWHEHALAEIERLGNLAIQQELLRQQMSRKEER